MVFNGLCSALLPLKQFLIFVRQTKTERQRDREAERQRDRETERQRDREDRKTE